MIASSNYSSIPSAEALSTAYAVIVIKALGLWPLLASGDFRHSESD